MIDLVPADFAGFFSEVNGHPPFQWQIRLCQYVLDEGRWPDAISAPTGSGKSAVIDIHLFVNALNGWGVGPRVPRRLAAVVNRRAVVDSHHDRADSIRSGLAQAQPGSIAESVRTGLGRLSADSTVEPFILARLRGGLGPDSSVAKGPWPTGTQWVDDPTACAVICATPDMWGSRIFFQGYGSSRFAKPREAGLLARDSVMILDEAHLNRQLLFASRRVVQLQRRDEIGVPTLQVVATTATPDGQAETEIGVDLDADLVSDPVLAQRLQRPKPLVLSRTSTWPAGKRPSKAFAQWITDQVVQQVDSVEEHETVGCVVNTVGTALDVCEQLRKLYGGNAVLLWIGPMRPLDLADLRDQHPGAFTVTGDPSVRVVVATQTLEVGVDVDFAALVTELASGTALAQRAGRVNRLGLREQGPCVVVAPEESPSTRHGPYTAIELAQAYEWLCGLAQQPSGLAPAALAASPPPEAALARAVLSRPESGDIATLTTTSENLVAEVEITRWLHDDLRADPPTVGIVRRAELPVDDIAALALLNATPVSPEEIYPASIGVARDVIDDVVRQTKRNNRRAFRIRDGQLTAMDVDDENRERVLPGDVLVLDADHAVVRSGLIAAHGGDTSGRVIWGDAVRVLLFDNQTDAPVLRRMTRALWEGDSADDDWSAQATAVGIVEEAFPDLVGTSFQVEIPAAPSSVSDTLPWAVIRTTDAVAQQADTQQTWTGQGRVSLDDHQRAVAQRAQELGARLGLPDQLKRSLFDAGKHHDDGKSHPEFQRVLGRVDGEAPLAKSGDDFVALPRRRRRRSALPPGWRHEQLSVVYAAAALAARDRDERELVVRLVGTSHGRGRTQFPHAARDVLSGEADNLLESAEVLFDQGGWEELADATERRWGIWECAYLEAVLRAADCMVSREGS